MIHIFILSCGIYFEVLYYISELLFNIEMAILIHGGDSSCAIDSFILFTTSSDFILKAIKLRMRSVDYLYNNGLHSMPFYSNDYTKSVSYDKVIITSGMHAIAYKACLFDRLCHSILQVKDPRSIKGWKISVLAKYIIAPEYPVDKDFVPGILSISEHGFASQKVDQNDNVLVDYSPINFVIIANAIAYQNKLDKNQLDFAFSVIDKIYLYIMQNPRNIDLTKFDFVIDDSSNGPQINEMDIPLPSTWNKPYNVKRPIVNPMAFKIIKRKYSTISEAKNIRSKYIRIRKSNPNHTFSMPECDKIRESYSILGQNFKNNHPLVNHNPDDEFMSKGVSDELAISLWNDILPKRFNADTLQQLRKQAVAFIKYMDLTKPLGKGFTEKETIQYVTASSSSAFLGIQNASKSTFALDSMTKTLEAHSAKTTVNRDWLIPNLGYIHDYLMTNPDIMNRDYGDVVLNAKASSASIPGVSNYRDFVSQNTLDTILTHSVKFDDNEVPYLMYAGVRNSNRAKYRLIFSMSAYFRAIDYLINNGSYSLCTHDGLLSKYTTEGYTDSKLWVELAKMTNRNGVSMMCIDFKGYDTQISILDYINISILLNKHRFTDPKFSKMFMWYYNWLYQPKPLVTRTIDTLGNTQYQWVLEYQDKLASGLHGTHSFENLYGIATMHQMENIGVKVENSWFNGDDQNFLIRSSDVDTSIDWLQTQFDISWDKSLINHNLSVWAKQWFTKEYHPIQEIGTFRSIFEREGGEVNFVEKSKLASNYCKVLQVAIILIRLGKGHEYIRHWINILCRHINVDSSRIPVFLESLKISSQTTNLNLPKAKGIESSKSFLLNKTFNVSVFNTYNYYDMLMNMYANKTFYSLEPKQILYYPKDTVLRISRGIDYSIDESKDIPWIYRNLSRKTSFTDEQLFVRSVLQGTKSFDGPSDNDYSFYDMLSLAYAINNRNKDVWRNMV